MPFVQLNAGRPALTNCIMDLMLQEEAHGSPTAIKQISMRICNALHGHSKLCADTHHRQYRHSIVCNNNNGKVAKAWQVFFAELERHVSQDFPASLAGKIDLDDSTGARIGSWKQSCWEAIVAKLACNWETAIDGLIPIRVWITWACCTIQSKHWVLQDSQAGADGTLTTRCMSFFKCPFQSHVSCSCDCREQAI